MKFNVIVLPGDGVGPEVAAEGVKILETVGGKFGHAFKLQYGLVGGAAIDESGSALTDETLKLCKRSDAVLLGAVGGPKWDDPLAKVRPEDGLLKLRKALEESGRRLVLSTVGKQTKEVFTVTGLDNIFEFIDDQFVALAGLQLVGD